jgi:nitrogen fixation/metabolism regulation signal transduction histidine kinase
VSPGRRRRALTHDQRTLLLALGAGAPALVATGILLTVGGYSARVQWTVGILVGLTWLGFAFATQSQVIHPLRTLSNLLAALREEDYSFRARRTRGDDALSQAMSEVNALADTLREQRLGALEATALLRKVAEEIDVAVFTFDGDRRLRLLNRAAERILARPSEQLLGRTADELGLAVALGESGPRVLELVFPGGLGRYEARHSVFRQGGRPHQLLVLADLSRALRDEERQAWQRLIRVIGHELNNSLAPIKSIAGSLEALLSRDPKPADVDEDMRRGLSVIGARAESLSRFMEAYARLARLPAPKLAPVDIGALVRRVAGLETRLPIQVETSATVRAPADVDQLEQLLINVFRNAVDATLETGGGVRAGWKRLAGAGQVEIWIDDDGPGLPPSTNLFVPFFTTKPQGSGIGLVLARQIAEAHGGALALGNREGARGCRAILRLPL